MKQMGPVRLRKQTGKHASCMPHPVESLVRRLEHIPRSEAVVVLGGGEGNDSSIQCREGTRGSLQLTLCM